MKLFELFFDVEMNLDTGSYQPHRKPENMPVYISKKSNHHSTMIKVIPKAIANQISDISSSEAVFNESFSIYSDSLRKSSFHGNITFIPKNH